jgi:molecular chaperone DnaJ
MLNEHDTRYVVSLSLEEAALGCAKAIKIRTSRVCPSCNGSGKSSRLDSAVCPKCRGVGQTYHVCPITVQIPGGVEHGCQIRASTKGQARLKGWMPKELSIVISVRAHRLFRRSGDDIIYEAPLDFAQAALGTEMMVPTLKGDVRLRIPPGTQAGKIFRLKGKGASHFGRRGKGDHIVQIRVVTPGSLDGHQRWLLEQLAMSLPQSKLGKSKLKM